MKIISHTVFFFILSLALIVCASNKTFAQPTTDWSLPDVSISLLGQSSSVPKISVSADGTKAIAIWSVLDAMQLKVQTRVATITGNVATWGVTFNTIGVGTLPQIAISADGTTATAIWFDVSNVKSASATITGNTATWGSVVDVYTVDPIINYLEEPLVKLSADGSMATAIWADTPPMSGKIVKSASATISGNTTTWGAVTDLNTSGQDPKKADLALSADGATAIVTWARSNGTNSLAQSTIATIAGNVATWGSIEDVSSSGQDTYESKVDLSADGATATVVWAISTLSEPQVKNRTANIASGVATWGSIVNVSPNILQSVGTVKVSISNDGSKTASSWISYEGSNSVIQSANAVISGNTATWGSVQDLSDVGTSNDEPSIAISGDGTIATAIWSRNGSSEYIIQGRSASILGNIATWGNSADISTSGQFSYLSSFGLSDNGTMGTALWNANGSGFSEIHSTSFVVIQPTPTSTPTATITTTTTPTATSTPTPIATNTQATTVTPTPANTLDVDVVNSKPNSNLGTPQIESSSRNTDGSSSIKICINFSKVKGTANIYGVVKRSSHRRNIVFKRVKRGNPCFTFSTTLSGLYEMFFRQNRYLLPPLFSKKLRVNVD